MMEPEPGRCRRTDGKKWRCKNDVVCNTKYCERHIHRGCNRSRKLVEGAVSSPIISPSITSQPLQQASSYEAPPLLLRPLAQSNSTKNLEKLCDVSCNLISKRSLVGDVALEAPAISSKSVNTEVNCDIAASKDASEQTSHDKASTMVGLGTKPTHNLVVTPALGGLKRRTSTESTKFTSTVKPVDAAYINGIGKEHTSITGSDKVSSNSKAATSSNATGQKITTQDVDLASSGATSTIAISMVEKSDSGERRSHSGNNSQLIGKDNVPKRTTHIRDIDKLKVNTSQGFNFSPKSVLRGMNDHHPNPYTNPSIQGCSPSCVYRSDSEEQPWRCRRTDGRKWRCRRDVLPNEKYCVMHMHRGAKKPMQNSQLADLPSGKRSKTTTHHPHLNVSLPSKEKNTGLNTDLSICALEISRPVVEDDEPSSACGSSDATISDDNISYENN